jgi:hypothetical protein
MDWVTLALAVYGAGLSSFLAVLAWKRDRPRLIFSSKVVSGGTWMQLHVTVVNGGHRPIALASAHFEAAEGQRYLMALDETLGLPCKLEVGDALPMTFDVHDLWEGTCAFVVRAYDRDHRHAFDADFRSQWERYLERVERG